MNDKTKKYLIAGAIGLVTITGALAYLQYQKLKEYKLKFKSIVIKKLSVSGIDLNLFLDFINKSKTAFTITNQEYNVYVNGVFISKIVNTAPTYIKANATTPVGVNVTLSPSEIGKKIKKGLLDIVNDPANIKIKFDCKLQVKVLFFKMNIPFVYEDTLKNMLKPTTTSV